MKRSQFLTVSGLGAGALLFPQNLQAGTGNLLTPYLETLRPDSVWVTWWTDSGTQSTVEFGTAPGQLTRQATGTVQNKGVGYRYHSVQMTGLLPSTYYFYCIRSGSASSAVCRFRTPPAIGTKTGRFRVLVLGDNQIVSTERRWEKLIGRAKTKLEEKFSAPIEEAVDLILNVGDQVDVGTLDHWRNLHFAYGAGVTPNLASMTTVGNHETYSGDGTLALYKSLFHYDQISYGGVLNPGGGKTYYAHQQANILFVHLNSESMPVAAEGAGLAQKAWVQQVVDAAKNDPTVDFMISLVHRPYQAEQYVGDISSWFRGEIMPILAQTEKHVLNIGAHHHLYARGQTREWPIYHIISGASAWDQFWGQSTEQDFDDVQKTIANWAWQLLDFDLATREMRVECYAEANVRFPEAQRWTTQAYNSRLIDSFHRKLGIAPPSRPAITNPGGGPGLLNTVTLPYTLLSSGFASTAGEQLNSTQFQVAADPDFISRKVDIIRDSVNLYGDTGAPLYEPVNVNAAIDILQLDLLADSLPNTRWFSRVRHRDTNAVWSEWSPVWEFSVQGSSSNDPKLVLQKNIYAPTEDIVISYERLARPTADWIGIYPVGTAPESAPAISRQYVTSGAGTRTFRMDLPPGEYFAGLFEDNTTTELAARVPFLIGKKALITTPKPGIDTGEALAVSWTDGPGAAQDTISVFRAGVNPGPGITPTASVPARTPVGMVGIGGLPNGYYYAVLLARGGTFEVSQRLGVSVGTLNALVSMATAQVVRGNDFTVNFSGGPGIPKDWIGLFATGSTPGLDPLLAYLYFEGRTAGSVTFRLPTLAVGGYFVAMFTNDSYTEVSNRFPFALVPN